MGDAFLQGQVLCYPPLGMLDPHSMSMVTPPRMRMRKVWHKEDRDICCLFNAISSVSGTQKMLNKHLVNEPKNE